MNRSQTVTTGLFLKAAAHFLAVLGILGCSSLPGDPPPREPSPSLHGIYLTWDSPDTARTLVVNVVSRAVIDHIELHFSEAEHPGRSAAVQSETRSLTNVDVHVYSFRLQNLKPSTLYGFSISGDKLAPTAPRTFRTLPADSSPVEVVQGGDLSVHKDLVTVAQQAVTKNTLAFLVGGDLAYDNGDVTKLELWLDLIKLLERSAVSPDKRMIPFVMGVGNHEVNRKNSSNPIERSPFYFLFFRQNELKTYFRRDLGANAVLLNLDSGHVTKHSGEQRDWLEAELQRLLQTPHRLAMYHVPLYPSIRSYKEAYSALGRQEWLPLFDRYGVTLSFENHDHSMKRTHMLKNGKAVESSGTVYVGDGCWGVGPRFSEKAWFIKNIQPKKHLWRVQINPTSVTATAVGFSGETLDSFKIEGAKVIENQ